MDDQVRERTGRTTVGVEGSGVGDKVRERRGAPSGSVQGRMVRCPRSEEARRSRQQFVEGQ